MQQLSKPVIFKNIFFPQAKLEKNGLFKSWTVDIFFKKNRLISIFGVFPSLPWLLTSHFVTKAHFFLALVSETTSETDYVSVRGREENA